MLLGEYEEAMKPFSEAVRLSPESATDRLNLADTLKLMGRKEESQEQYLKVLELCDKEPNPSDPAILSLRAQALAHLGRGAQAVAAAGRALQLDPEDPGLLFEAALVYTLVGEHLSAINCAEQALDAGFQRKWFELPWFDNLLAYSEFQEHLEKASPDGVSTQED
jgi:serine/threonine-protein kinase